MMFHLLNGINCAFLRLKGSKSLRGQKVLTVRAELFLSNNCLIESKFEVTSREITLVKRNKHSQTQILIAKQ